MKRRRTCQGWWIARRRALTARGEPRKPANAMRIRRIAADFDAADPAIEVLFGGEET